LSENNLNNISSLKIYPTFKGLGCTTRFLLGRRGQL
jgi:hypothetical protein